MFTAVLLLMMNLIVSGAVEAGRGPAPAGPTAGENMQETQEAPIDKLDEVLQKLVDGDRDGSLEISGPVRVVVRTRKDQQETLGSKLQAMDIRIVKTFTVLPAFVIEVAVEHIVEVAKEPEVVRMSADAGVAP